MIGIILDQSYWNKRCYFPKAIASGAIATFIRAGSIDNSNGLPYTDYIFHENIADAIQYSVPFGAYFYSRPRFDGNVQGRYFANLLRPYQEQMRLPAVVDVEEFAETPIIAAENVKKIIYQLQAFGFKVMIYTRQTIWDFGIAPDPLWSTIDLWAARWTSDPLSSPWGDGRYKFRGWNTWKFWQKEANRNGRAAEFGFPPYPIGDNDVDISYYNGTKEDFEREYGAIVQPPPQLVKYEVLIDGLNVRSEPQIIAGNSIGNRKIGDIITILEYGGNNFWVKDDKGWSAVNYNGNSYMKRIE